MQRPSTSDLSSSTVSEGVRSRARMMEGVVSPAAGDSVTPRRMHRTRVTTSRASAARALRYLSSSASNICTYISMASLNAASALTHCPSMIVCTAFSSSGSSSIIVWAWKMAACSAPTSASALADTSDSCTQAVSSAPWKRVHSAVGSSTVQRSKLRSVRWKRKEGPMAIPREAAMPRSVFTRPPQSRPRSGSPMRPVQVQRPLPRRR